MSVAKPFRNLLEDISENAADIIIIIIGILIFTFLIKIGGKLWSGLQGLWGGISDLGLGGSSGGGVSFGPGSPPIYTPTGQGPPYVTTFPSQGPSLNFQTNTNPVGMLTSGKLGIVNPNPYPQISQYFTPSGPGIAQNPGVQSYPNAYGQGATMYIVPQWTQGYGGSSNWGVPSGIITNPSKLTIKGGAGGKF
jgi:hypothetical protein